VEALCFPRAAVCDSCCCCCVDPIAPMLTTYSHPPITSDYSFLSCSFSMLPGGRCIDRRVLSMVSSRVTNVCSLFYFVICLVERHDVTTEWTERTSPSSQAADAHIYSSSVLEQEESTLSGQRTTARQLPGYSGGDSAGSPSSNDLVVIAVTSCVAVCLLSGAP